MSYVCGNRFYSETISREGQRFSLDPNVIDPIDPPRKTLILFRGRIYKAHKREHTYVKTSLIYTKKGQVINPQTNRIFWSI